MTKNHQPLLLFNHITQITNNIPCSFNFELFILFICLSGFLVPNRIELGVFLVFVVIPEFYQLFPKQQKERFSSVLDDNEKDVWTNLLKECKYITPTDINKILWMLTASEMFLWKFSNDHDNIASIKFKMAIILMDYELRNIKYLFFHNKNILIKFLHMVDTKIQMLFKSIFNSITTFCGDLWFTISKPILQECCDSFLKFKYLTVCVQCSHLTL